MLNDLLSRKFLMTLAFSALGFYLVMVGKLDASQFMIALGANLGVYSASNVVESFNSKTDGNN